MVSLAMKPCSTRSGGRKARILTGATVELAVEADRNPQPIENMPLLVEFWALQQDFSAPLNTPANPGLGDRLCKQFVPRDRAMLMQADQKLEPDAACVDVTIHKRTPSCSRIWPPSSAKERGRGKGSRGCRWKMA